VLHFLEAWTRHASECFSSTMMFLGQGVVQPRFLCLPFIPSLYSACASIQVLAKCPSLAFCHQIIHVVSHLVHVPFCCVVLPCFQRVADFPSISQCQRRSLDCKYPLESHRGMRKKRSSFIHVNVDGPKVTLRKQLFVIHSPTHYQG